VGQISPGLTAGSAAWRLGFSLLVSLMCRVYDNSLLAGSHETHDVPHLQVYDMAFCRDNTHALASVSADGSVRMFDLRSLEHSTIIYDDAAHTPLLRLAWNKQDNNYLATMKVSNFSISGRLRSPAQSPSLFPFYTSRNHSWLHCRCRRR